LNAFKGALDHHQEILADCLLGKVDALMAMDDLAINFRSDLHQSCLSLWSALLMCGIRMPMVGGSGKASNCDLLGNTRTYAKLAQDKPCTYGNWIEAIRAGRTFVTTGPVISLEVDGHGPGDVIDSARGDQVRVRAEARANSELDSLEVIVNGKTVKSVHPAAGETVAVLEFETEIAESSWAVARCGGPYHWPRWSRLAAITSPVYIQVGGRQIQADPTTIAALDRDLNYMLEWAARKARCDDKQRERFMGIFRSAQEELRKRSTV
jgi:hypothetical protein